MPMLPPRLELVLLLSAAATGYNLTMQILPSQRIDLAHLEIQEGAKSANVSRPSHSSSVLRSSQSISPASTVVMDMAGLNERGICAIPSTGGPALNERFEPC